MADVKLSARAPLDGVAKPGRSGATGPQAGLLIEERTQLALATVIARRGAAAAVRRAVADAYGLDLPEGPSVVAQAGVSFAGTAPGQWFATAEGTTAADFVSGLRMHLQGIASITDQSDGRVVLQLSGPHVRDVLAKGIPVDLHPRKFKAGDTATTLVAHIGVQLVQLDDAPTFQLSAFRSFAGSLLSWLTSSAAEFGCEIKS